MKAISLTHTTGTLVKYTRWLTRLFTLMVLVICGFSLTAPSAKAASLTGKTVNLNVRYQVTTQEGVSIDQSLYTGNFVVNGTQEVSTPFTFTYVSGGFNQTFSGTLTATVSGNAMTVGFSGQEQPGGACIHPVQRQSGHIRRFDRADRLFGQQQLRQPGNSTVFRQLWQRLHHIGFLYGRLSAG